MAPVDVTVESTNQALAAGNATIQAVVNSVAAEGGGKVVIPPGVYAMQDSLHLRSGVHVEGSGSKTVLRKAPEVRSALSADLGYGHYDVSVAEPEKFAVGMGVLVADDRAGGFYQTVATLTWREGDRFGTSRMLHHDYSRRENGFVASVFPVVSADGVEDASVSSLAIDGNRAQNPTWLGGCRGGGVFLIQTRGVGLRRLHISDLNADGISFQQTVGTVVEDCVCEDNVGHGLHPGSGSVGAVMRRCVCRRNGQDGIYYCLRVTYSLCEECTFEDNARHGISIGGRDTDHLIRRNTVRGNAREGIYFRPHDAVMAGHRNVIEANEVAGNCRVEGDAEIHLAAPVRDVYLLGNRVEPAEGIAALRIAEGTEGVVLHDNRTRGDITIVGDPAAVHRDAPAAPLAVGPDHAPHGAAGHLAPENVEDSP